MFNVIVPYLDDFHRFRRIELSRQKLESYPDNFHLLHNIELLLQLIPVAYPLNPSKARPMVRVGMAHYIEHTSLLGSFPDFDVLRMLTPVASYPENPDALERLRPSGTTKTEWNKEAAKEFLKDYKFARYRELVSGLELGPDDLK